MKIVKRFDWKRMELLEQWASTLPLQQHCQVKSWSKQPFSKKIAKTMIRRYYLHMGFLYLQTPQRISFASVQKSWREVRSAVMKQGSTGILNTTAEIMPHRRLRQYLLQLSLQTPGAEDAVWTGRCKAAWDDFKVGPLYPRNVHIIMFTTERLG